VFLGDHGYHLGERGIWSKATLFERSCRAPLLIAAPGMKGGQHARGLVEFIDIFPTLCDLASLTPPDGLAGQSLKPMLLSPDEMIKEAAHTLATRGTGGSGRRVRTQDWAFIEWSDGSAELYDHRTDPEEQQNVADKHPEVVALHRAKLQSLPPLPERESKNRRK
jgi:iduronate 2-sulfatase